MIWLVLLACPGTRDKAPAGDSSPPTDSPAPCGAEVCAAGLCRVQFCAGSFPMGSPAGEGEDAERPQRTVQVHPFQLAVSETTVAQYAACVADGVCAPYADPDEVPARCNWGKEGREAHPMNCADWSMAATFCAWAGGRLPSEAEWEYAARSEGQDHVYPWGDAEPSCTLAVLADTCGAEGTWPVCSFPAGNTTQGLCDLAGNAFEWVQDLYHDSYTGAPADSQAWEDPTSPWRVLRGGGIGSDEDLRTRNRTFHEPDFFYSGMGWRCAW